MADNIVTLQGVSKSFNGQLILQEINLDVKNGEFLTLLGPSGCGKTTLLRMISGFEEPDNGIISINGKNAKGLPPHERHIHTVFQSYALFPHMSVFENVAFGLRCNKTPENEITSRVLDALRMVKLDEFSDRKPAQLSGGQQQRVAIARAVVNRPLVLLLDEPLSSLDYRLRKLMQLELRQLQRTLGITFIFVTHDQEEALSMSDRVVVMDQGVITQIGTPREVYEEPASLSVAKFIGEVNIFETVVDAVDGDNLTVTIEGMQRTCTNRKGFAKNDKVLVLLRPEDIRVYDNNEVDDTRHMYRGTVEEVIYKGTTVDLMVRFESGTLLAATEFFDEDDDSLVYTIGEKVWLHWVSGWEVILPYEK
jgi:spermidine/putrescine transport system ATP-binding protein